MKGEKQNPLAKYKVKKAVELLKEEIQSIPDVQTWASEFGGSSEWLYKSIYELPPKITLFFFKSKKRGLTAPRLVRNFL